MNGLYFLDICRKKIYNVGQLGWTVEKKDMV